MENIFYYMTGFAHELRCEDVIVVCTTPTIAIKPRIVRKVRFLPRNTLPMMDSPIYGFRVKTLK